MKVTELIKQLQELEPDRIVVMSSDGEGNSFSPLADMEQMAYEANSTYSGDARLEKLTDELRKQGYAEEDVAGPDAVKAVVLFPTN